MVFGRFAALVSRIAVGLGTHGGHEVDVQLDGTRGRGLAWSHEVEHIDEARRHFAEHAPRVLEPFSPLPPSSLDRTPWQLPRKQNKQESVH